MAPRASNGTGGAAAAGAPPALVTVDIDATSGPHALPTPVVAQRRSKRAAAANGHGNGTGYHAPGQQLEGGGGVGAWVRDACLGFIPPHVRRKGLQAPPVGSMARKLGELLCFPYFSFAGLDYRSYLSKFALSDLMAGITVGVFLVPQSMAYAVIANLPPIYGLYASTVAGFVYALFGTSGQLSIGAVVLVSLFMSEAYANMGVPLVSKDKDPVLNAQAHYHTYVRCQMAAVVSLGAALVLCGMALFRVGSLMRFVSSSVLTGFVTGSAVYIFISQSKYIWGFKVPRQEVNLEEFQYLFKHIGPDAKRDTMAVGLSSFFILLFFVYARKHLMPRIRALRTQGRPRLSIFLTAVLSSVTLLAIVFTTLATYHLVKNGSDIQIIGKVPAGFNKLEWPAVVNNFYGEGIPFGKVVASAVPIALLTYLESISVGRKYALVHKYALDMSQELWALGLCCLFASFFQAYPPGGGFSRTALNNEIGARTPFANIVASAFVGLVLVAATGLLKYVPMAVLAAIICANITTLFDFHEMWRALWVAPVDFVVMAFTFFVTFLWNVEKGLEYGIILSVAILLLQFSRLDMDSIGHLTVVDERAQAYVGAKAGTHFRPLDSNYPAARQHPSVKVLRLRANLFFGNVSIFRDEFFNSLAESSSDPSSQPLRAVIIDASGVPEMDLSALSVIDELVTEMAKQDVEVFIAGACPRVAKSLEAYDLLDEVGGAELVALDVGDVFHAVVAAVEGEDAATKQLPPPPVPAKDAAQVLAEYRAAHSGAGGHHHHPHGAKLAGGGEEAKANGPMGGMEQRRAGAVANGRGAQQ